MYYVTLKVSDEKRIIKSILSLLFEYLKYLNNKI